MVVLTYFVLFLFDVVNLGEKKVTYHLVLILLIPNQLGHGQRLYSVIIFSFEFFSDITGM